VPTYPFGSPSKKESGRALGFVELRVPEEGEAVTRKSFTFPVKKKRS